MKITGKATPHSHQPQTAMDCTDIRDNIYVYNVYYILYKFHFFVFFF